MADVVLLLPVLFKAQWCCSDSRIRTSAGILRSCIISKEWITGATAGITAGKISYGCVCTRTASIKTQSAFTNGNNTW